MSNGRRSPAAQAERTKREAARVAAKRRTERHPLFSFEERQWLRNLVRDETVSPYPDRRDYALDADRQAAIEAHRRRVKRREPT